MKNFIKSIKEGISEVLFPTICMVCGLRLSSTEHFVCSRCLNEKFEEANSMGLRISSDTLLPEGIWLQHALWNFDKGGDLQELLHNLKYQRLTGLGIDLGRQLGQSLQGNPCFDEIRSEREEDDMVLIPVPLHARKIRSRGYNQAYYIAKGVSDVLNLAIVAKDVVMRQKNTQTQTGFSLEKRKENMEGAFTVTDLSIVENRIAVIIDDVFTTGATTFELSGELKKAGAEGILIATVAQA